MPDTPPSLFRSRETTGLVLSGGGSRAAYQVGALKAIAEALPETDTRFSVLVGSSVGALNSIVLGAGLHLGLKQSIEGIVEIWRTRCYANTFAGSPTRAFLRAIQVAVLRYRAPGPFATSVSIFDPQPLERHLADILKSFGGCRFDSAKTGPAAVAIMTTLEGITRTPLLLVASREPPDEASFSGAAFEIAQVKELTASHGCASAALPSVLPAVDLNLETRQVRLVDGGICDNIPVDPAVRLGAENVIVIDSSGRRWWQERFEKRHDLHPNWEVRAQRSTYCRLPLEMVNFVNIKPLGPLLQKAVGTSTRDFMSALGPTWPIFRILRHKMGLELAYEVMSYVALHPAYVSALIELGYEETRSRLAALISARNAAAKQPAA